MTEPSLDILMITHNRPEYTKRSLPSLLNSVPEYGRVWVWQNGSDEETLEVVRTFERHDRFFRFYHSPENVKLTAPTNWLWEEAEGLYLGKVDDDCIVPDGWVDRLLSAHEAGPELGAVGCWHFMPGDVDELEVLDRLVALGDHKIMRNCWIGGSGYLMKRAAQSAQGLLRQGQSWPHYVLEMSARGWINGWYYPFLYQEHMDDPRSQFTMFRTDDDVQRMAGLTARQRGITTVRSLLERQQIAVGEILNSSLNPKQYMGFRRKFNQIKARIGLSDGRQK